MALILFWGEDFTWRSLLNYFTRHEGRSARNQYQKAIDIVSELKKEKQIGLTDLRNLKQTQAKLQTLEN